MEDENLNPNNEEQNLRDENLFLRMRLIAEHGAHFSGIENNEDLHPELENQFLKYVQEYEDKYKSAEQIVIHDALGNPSLEAEKDIPDERIAEALNSVMELLGENGISLDTICEVDDRTLYRFITEELINEEIDVMDIPGMRNCFIYEDFHPNHEYDIHQYCYDFVHDYFSKNNEFYTCQLTDEADGNSFLSNFRESFDSFTLESFEVTDLSIGEERAYAEFSIDFKGEIRDGNLTQRYQGNGRFEFKYQNDFWYIDRVELPPITRS